MDRVSGQAAAKDPVKPAAPALETVALGDQDQYPRLLLSCTRASRVGALSDVLSEQTVSIARRKPLPELLDDEGQLRELLTRIPPLPARAADRDHEPIALFPGAQR